MAANYQLRTRGGTRLDIVRFSHNGKSQLQNVETKQYVWIKDVTIIHLLQRQRLSLYGRSAYGFRQITGPQDD